MVTEKDNQPELDVLMANYGNKTIVVQSYIYEREEFIMRMVSRMQHLKAFLLRDNVVCFNSQDEIERKYLINMLDEYLAEAQRLLK